MSEDFIPRRDMVTTTLRDLLSIIAATEGCVGWLTDQLREKRAPAALADLPEAKWLKRFAEDEARTLEWLINNSEDDFRWEVWVETPSEDYE